MSIYPWDCVYTVGLPFAYFILFISVKGAKYDPSGRPPKGVPNGSSLGWVGPPAGLKYPDRPPDG